MTVYESLDGGQSWHVRRNVFSGMSAYSSLQVLPAHSAEVPAVSGSVGGGLGASDRLGLLWETAGDGEPSYHRINYLEV